MPRRLLRSAARTAGRTALIAGTATAVSGHVAHRQHEKRVSHAVASRNSSGNGARGRAGGDTDDIVSKLQTLAELRSSGALSDKEFSAAKAKLLER